MDVAVGSGSAVGVAVGVAGGGRTKAVPGLPESPAEPGQGKRAVAQTAVGSKPVRSRLAPAAMAMVVPSQMSWSTSAPQGVNKSSSFLSFKV